MDGITQGLTNPVLGSLGQVKFWLDKLICPQILYRHYRENTVLKMFKAILCMRQEDQICKVCLALSYCNNLSTLIILFHPKVNQSLHEKVS